MFIVSANGQRALREVHVADCANETDDAVIRFAMESQRENKSSLFDWKIRRYGDNGHGATVELWRD